MQRMDSAARELLTRPNIAHVATLMADGAPHVVPTWVGLEGDSVVFLTGPESQKARNLADDPRLSLSIADAEHPSRMAHLRGRVTRRIEGDEAWTIIDRLAHEYLGGPYPRGVDRVVFVVTPGYAVAHDYG